MLKWKIKNFLWEWINTNTYKSTDKNAGISRKHAIAALREVFNMVKKCNKNESITEVKLTPFNLVVTTLKIKPTSTYKRKRRAKERKEE